MTIIKQQWGIKVKILHIILLAIYLTTISVFIGTAQETTDLGCLETVWQRTNPTEAEKKFDIKNDKGISGSRFSCKNDVSPTEIKTILNVLQTAVKTGDVRDLSKLVIYPITYMPRLEKRNEHGGMFGHVSVLDEADFIIHFDRITSTLFKDIVTCARVKLMTAGEPFGVLLGSGYIYFAKDPETNELKLSLTNAYTKRQFEWLEQFCN